MWSSLGGGGGSDSGVVLLEVWYCFLEVLPRALFGKFVVLEVFGLGEFLALLPSVLPGLLCVSLRAGAQPPFHLGEGGGRWGDVDLLVGVCVEGMGVLPCGAVGGLAHRVLMLPMCLGGLVGGTVGLRSCRQCSGMGCVPGYLASCPVYPDGRC